VNKFQQLGLQSGWARHAGQNLAEYGLVLGLVAVVAIGSLGAMGTMISDTLTNMNGILTGTVTTGGPTQIAANPDPNSGGTAENDTLAPNEAPPAETGGNPQETASGPGWEMPTPADLEPQPEILPPSGGTSPTMDPAYEAWLAQNPQTANLINQLSPDGQDIANGLFQEASSGHLPTQSAIFNLNNHPALPEQDRWIVSAYLDSFMGGF
jgi:Flp pilus assembly pilin Flp